jgi:hypothetical protein
VNARSGADVTGALPHLITQKDSAVMTEAHHPTIRYRGQHRRQAGDPAMRCVEGIWLREHPGTPTTPIDYLGCRPHTPRHAADPTRKRVYL